jgi:hypothetical protein
LSAKLFGGDRLSTISTPVAVKTQQSHKYTNTQPSHRYERKGPEGGFQRGRMVFQAESPNKREKSIEKKEAQGNDRRESQ